MASFAIGNKAIAKLPTRAPLHHHAAFLSAGARRVPRASPFRPSRRTSAGFWCARGCPKCRQKRHNPASHPARRQPLRRVRSFPRQSPISLRRARQSQLPVRREHEPRPAVSLFGMAQSWGRPAERLLEEAEGVFEIEAAYICSPDDAQVRRIRPMPPQPEDLRVVGLTRQAADLDQDECPRHNRCRAAGATPGMPLHLRMQSRP